MILFIQFQSNGTHFRPIFVISDSTDTKLCIINNDKLVSLKNQQKHIVASVVAMEMIKMAKNLGSLMKHISLKQSISEVWFLLNYSNKSVNHLVSEGFFEKRTKLVLMIFPPRPLAKMRCHAHLDKAFQHFKSHGPSKS